MHQRMQSMSSGFSFHFGEKDRREPIRISARLETSRKELQVGTEFEYILSLEAPRTCTIGQIRMTPSQTFGMTVTGEARNLKDGKSANPTNVVERLAVPVRYDVPFRGPISFTVGGMVTGRQGGDRRGGFFSFTFSNSFSCETDPIDVDIRPLPTDNQPKDFAGVISEGLRIHEMLDLLTVETNDVIQITYRLFSHGYVPVDFLPPGAAFEMGRNDQEGLIEYRRFFVADGTNETPRISVPYYDPRSKSYRKAETGGTRVTYK